MAKIPLARQAQSVERLAKLGAAALRKEGIRESEAEFILEAANAAAVTLRAILPYEAEVRDLLLSKKQGA